MKVGIITLLDNYNYGNRLQNYAVNLIMQDFGIDAVTINIENKEYYPTAGKVKNIIKTLMPIHIFVFYSALKMRLSKNKLENKRERNFRKFNKQYIIMKTYFSNWLKHLYCNKQLQECNYFLTGSDQVWNPDWAGQDKYFLTFAPPEKRIAFIASIGASELPAEQQERYKALLSQMKYISVREESAVELIRQLTGIKADCFFDPVLLVNRERWLDIEELVPFKIPSRYILSFFLGDEPKGEIDQFAARKKAEVIHMDQPEYPQYYTLNPAQLLYLIRNADYILTDSFHVTAFSIIFQKQFSVFRRKQKDMENMFSRMETLLGRLGLMWRVQEASKIEEIDDISEIQYRQIAQILIAERKRLDETMRKVLK